MSLWRIYETTEADAETKINFAVDDIPAFENSYKKTREIMMS